MDLLADCMTAHWDTWEQSNQNEQQVAAGTPPAPHWPEGAEVYTYLSAPYTPQRQVHIEGPPPLDEAIAKQLFDCILRFIAQPVQTEEYSRMTAQQSEDPLRGVISKPTELDMAAHRVVEYLSASNWNLAYDIMQRKLKQLRMTSSDDIIDANGLQFISHMWLNSKKLSLVIQEISQSFLPLKASTQNLIATVLPDAIHNWIDRNPEDFVKLHLSERRLEGGAEVLFDIATQLTDIVKRRSILWPLQTALVLLIPEVFYMAVMMGETKGGATAKKVFFLENLRKSLRLPRASDIAATCLVNICQAASYFPADSESALLSFALDVQNEMREEIFKKQMPGSSGEESMIDRELRTKAFVTLCHLSLDTVIARLIPWCLDRNAPVSWKVSVFAGAGMLAQQVGYAG